MLDLEFKSEIAMNINRTYFESYEKQKIDYSVKAK